MLGITGRSDKELFEGFSEYESERASTTFWDDFSIADAYGAKGIKDTFRRAFGGWKDNHKYLTELVMVLNHKCWYYYQYGNAELSTLYEELYEQADAFGKDNLKGEELRFYLSVLD